MLHEVAVNFGRWRSRQIPTGGSAAWGSGRWLSSGLRLPRGRRRGGSLCQRPCTAPGGMAARPTRHPGTQATRHAGSQVPGPITGPGSAPSSAAFFSPLQPLLFVRLSLVFPFGLSLSPSFSRVLYISHSFSPLQPGSLLEISCCDPGCSHPPLSVLRSPSLCVLLTAVAVAVLHFCNGTW